MSFVNIFPFQSFLWLWESYVYSSNGNLWVRENLEGKIVNRILIKESLSNPLLIYTVITNNILPKDVISLAFSGLKVNKTSDIHCTITDKDAIFKALHIIFILQGPYLFQSPGSSTLPIIFNAVWKAVDSCWRN